MWKAWVDDLVESSPVDWEHGRGLMVGAYTLGFVLEITYTHTELMRACRFWGYDC